VVGGLIEENDVPLVHQQCGERYSPALTAAEIADSSLPIDIGEKAGNNISNLGISCPFVVCTLTHDGVLDCGVIRNVITLFQHSYSHSAARDNLARIRSQRPREHPNQGGFAFTVATDHPDAVPVVDPYGEATQDNLSRKLHMNSLGAQQMSHRSSLTCAARGG
jgi:hypothetical protein